MDTKIKQYVDFLIDSAESLTEKIKTVLHDNYEKMEVIYFVDYVMCDLLKSIYISDNKHLQIVEEYLKNHLFMSTISIGAKSPINYITFLNKREVDRANRMNEYKNTNPLMAWIIEENDKIIQNLVNSASSYICLKENEVMSFSEKLLPILKEHSQNHIENLRKLAGWKKVAFIDIMISQEKNIQNEIHNQITDIPDELELYYFSFYLVHSFYQKLDFISQNILTYYSASSLDNIVSSINGDFEKDEILNKRYERFEHYEIMWNQIDYDEDEEERMAMFFGFASKYIYGKNLHMMTLALMYPVIQEAMSSEVETYLNAVYNAIRKPKP